MNTPTSNRTYPLALLFLILTCAAILAGAIGPLLRSNSFDWFDNAFAVVIAAVLSALLGSALGALVGLYHFDRLAGVFSGVAVGAVLGPFAVLLVAEGPNGLGIVAPAVVIGSAILLIVAWLVRPASG
jgi:hypothetical protein